MNKTIIFLFFLVAAQICIAQENNPTVTSPQKTKKFISKIFDAPQVQDPADSTQKKKKYIPKISGVIQVHYLNEFNTNGDTIRDPDGFRILRARLTAKGNITKFISYELMIDPRAPEPRGILRDAFIEFRFDKIQLKKCGFLKYEKILVGQQKTQFGWENRQSITELYTVNRAEISDGASRGENLRDIGIGLLGHIPIKKYFRFENALTFTNGTRFNVAGPFDFNSKKAFWCRLGFGYVKKDFTVSLGGSLGIGGLRYIGDDVVDPADDVYADFKHFGADIQVDHKYFFLAGEFAMGTDMTNDTLYGEPMGYQALLAVKTKWKVGPLVRYDAFEDEWKVWTLGAYYGFPKDRFRILVNYIFRGNVKDIPEGHDDRLYIQMQVTF